MTSGTWTTARERDRTVSCWTVDWFGGAGATYGLLHIYRMSADNLWYLMRSVLYYAIRGKTRQDRTEVSFRPGGDKWVNAVWLSGRVT